MKDMVNAVLEAYPEAQSMVTEQDVEIVERLLRLDAKKWSERLNAGLGEYILGKTTFRAYVDTPDEPSNRVIVVGGEFGNSFWAQHNPSSPNPALVRAHAIRDMVDPFATLVYSAGDAVGERNMAFRHDERRALEGGSMWPVADRLNTVINNLPNINDIAMGTGIGMSLGAAVLSASMRIGLGPINAAVYVEAPNVTKRSAVQLGAAFFSSGGHLADNIKLNVNPEESAIASEHLRSIALNTPCGARGIARYVWGLLLPGNRALMPLMCGPTLAVSIEGSLDKKHRIVHAWGTRSAVSPATANRQIADRFIGNPSYLSRQLGGVLADHSLTNVYPLMGALARVASQ